ncbi:solute carrier family 66 member 3 isoform X2 [Homalodisca vitripennis]|uniref:solute carrier family 66 member 3 isoform X2 n=1 Tax=Homalodisca vitripennis TaxID=197043 RepID=UPI001EEB9ED0|nr:solute carrier family 66 member 3 isoform X2 [Homalodisca vitripennis]
MSILQLFSDFLSIITISSCLVLKVPQILSIYRLKSASGINIYGLLMELGSYTTTTCYNYVNGYALLSYMEYPIIIVQEYALIFLVLKYKHLFNTRTYVLITVYFVISLGFVSKVIPSPVLMYIIPLCTPVSLSSKAIQLWEILRTRNADSVSITTWLISAFTNFTRVFTIFMDSADKILLTNFILSGTLSSSIAVATKYFQTKKQD